jgi:hypothetical protein
MAMKNGTTILEIRIIMYREINFFNIEIVKKVFKKSGFSSWFNKISGNGVLIF